MKTMYVMLFLSTLAVVEAGMNWIVYEKIADFGQTITLYCNLDEVCKKTAGWVKWLSLSNYETLILSVKETIFEEDLKYDGRIGTNGFYLMIRNASFKDFEANYSCTYGIYTSPKKLLTRSDSFIDYEAPSETKGSMVTSKENSERQTVVIYILFSIVFILVAAVLSLSVCLYRVKRQVGHLKRSQDHTVDSDSGMEETAAADLERARMIQLSDNLPNSADFSTNRATDQLSQGAIHNTFSERNYTENSPKQSCTMNSTSFNKPAENATNFEEPISLRHNALSSSSPHSSKMSDNCSEVSEKNQKYSVENSEPANIEDFVKYGYESLLSADDDFSSLVIKNVTNTFMTSTVDETSTLRTSTVDETNTFRTSMVVLNSNQQTNLKEKPVVKT